MAKVDEKSEQSEDSQLAVHEMKEVFWRRGYEDASIEDIVRATGMNRYALYNRFGGKKDLFLASIEAYHLDRKRTFLESFGDPDADPFQPIRSVFTSVISDMAARKTGCLLCNTAMNSAPNDDEIAERIELYVDEIRNAFTKALVAAEARGALNTNLTPEAGAALLITVMFGVGVHAKGGAREAEMMAILDTTIAALSRERSQ